MTGTRGGIGRVAAMAIGLAVLLVLAGAGAARAGIYRVAQCGWGVGVELDPVQNTSGRGFSLAPAFCTPPPGVGPEGLRFEGAAATEGEPGMARARWVAPPGNTLLAARASWAGVMQPGFEQVLGVNIGTDLRPMVRAIGATTLGPVAAEFPPGAWALEVAMACPGISQQCARSLPSHLLLSGLTMTLLDPGAPTTALGGPLLDPGWHRGTLLLRLDGEDVGAAVRYNL